MKGTVMADNETNRRDAKLVQWLNEAHVKEAELEADLVAHIGLTEKKSYKQRLQKHLTETRAHKRRVAQRIKQLGGSPESPSVPAVPGALGEAAGKAIAAVKGQVGVGRALVTSQPETHMRNAQEELREEHVEIAIYTRLETLATAVGDRDTAKLARSIRRDEERMAKYLSAELERLVKEVVRNEIPREERAAPQRRSGSSSTGRTTARRQTTRSGASTTRRRSSSSSASSGARNRARSGSRS